MKHYGIALLLVMNMHFLYPMKRQSSEPVQEASSLCMWFLKNSMHTYMYISGMQEEKCALWEYIQVFKKELDALQKTEERYPLTLRSDHYAHILSNNDPKKDRCIRDSIALLICLQNCRCVSKAAYIATQEQYETFLRTSIESSYPDEEGMYDKGYFYYFPVLVLSYFLNDKKECDKEAIQKAKLMGDMLVRISVKKIKTTDSEQQLCSREQYGVGHCMIQSICAHVRSIDHSDITKDNCGFIKCKKLRSSLVAAVALWLKKVAPLLKHKNVIFQLLTIELSETSKKFVLPERFRALEDSEYDIKFFLRHIEHDRQYQLQALLLPLNPESTDDQKTTYILSKECYRV